MEQVDILFLRPEFIHYLVQPRPTRLLHLADPPRIDLARRTAVSELRTFLVVKQPHKLALPLRSVHRLALAPKTVSLLRRCVMAEVK